ncbi:MAG: CAP domain-containing protein [Candidatus Limnocylindrales bacterium]
MARPHARLAVFTRLGLAAALAAVVLTGVGPMAHPSGAAAAVTLDSMEATLLSMINAERTKRGLVVLRPHSGLVKIANDRAAYMASTQVMKHPSCVRCLFDNAGIQYYSGTEVIAWTGYAPGDAAIKSLFSAWRNSSLHWGILMSSRYNYIGLGAGWKSSGHGVFLAGLLTESKDRTVPWSQMLTVSRSGTTVSWTWRGADHPLQTHTAGLKNFDVQYRVDSGTWTTIRSATTARSLSLSSRAHGHYYSLRIRARDNLGYLSPYSAALKIWVP